jgi:threonine aldolase
VAVSDFRSDTVTKPSPAMRRAMAEAEVGDDVLDGDPTVRRLEEQVAELLGKEGAMFVPSGTMANQVALGVHTRPGDEIVVERSGHIVTWEGGAAGHLHGLQCLTLHAESGALDPDEVRRAIRTDSVHCPRTALVCVEQTFMGSGEAAGGRVLPRANLEAVRKVAREAGIPVHMDGARLWNAAVAAGVEPRAFAELADSISVCLSKGLGAPVGSLVAGDRAFLQKAMIVRKRLGGWMRQAGILAAAGLHALEHNRARLAEDHALARSLAEAVHGRKGLVCPPREVETNIVFVRVAHPRYDATKLAAALESSGVLVLPQTARALRFVTHLDVGPNDVDRLVQALDRLL